MAEDRGKLTWPKTPEEWLKHYRLVFADPNPDGLDLVPTLIDLSAAVEEGFVTPRKFPDGFETLRAAWRAHVLPLARGNRELAAEVARLATGYPAAHWWWRVEEG